MLTQIVSKCDQFFWVGPDLEMRLWLGFNPQHPAVLFLHLFFFSLSVSLFIDSLYLQTIVDTCQLLSFKPVIKVMWSTHVCVLR